MKSNLFAKAMREGDNSLIIASAADLKEALREAALNLIEEYRNTFALQTQANANSNKEDQQGNAAKYMTAAEVCEMLKISNTTLWRMGKKQKLLPIIVSGQRRYAIKDVNRLMQE